MAGEFYTNFCLDRYSSSICVRYVDEEGTRRNKKIVNGQFSPTLYRSPEDGDPVDSKTYMGEPLTAVRYPSIRDYNRQKRENKQADQDGKRRPHPTPTHGYGKFENMFIARLFDSKKVSNDWDMSKISVLYIDIETECEHGFPMPGNPMERINAVTLIDSFTGKTVVLGLEGDYTHPEDDPLLTYIKCDSEAKLLLELVKTWQEFSPDVVTGWNIERFDIPYIVNRILKLSPENGENLVSRLSPWGNYWKKTVRSMYGDDESYDFAGVSILDYMVVYKKFVLAPRDNYRLDTIVNVELGDEKLRHESGTPGHLLYRDHFQDFISYNIKDVTLLVALEEKIKLIQLCMTLAYTALVNYSDVLSQIRMWDNTIYATLAKDNIQVEIDKGESFASEYPGAYVKPPIPGKHDWVVSFDVTSEYPSLIRALNISPEKLRPGITFLQPDAGMSATSAQQIRYVDEYLDKNADLSKAYDKGLSVGANGYSFDNSSQGFLPAMVKTLFDERSIYKKEMIDFKKRAEVEKDPSRKKALKSEATRMDLLQNARKVQLNSLYGAMGNRWFRFFDLRMASAITLSGQLLIRWVARDVNDYVNKITGTEGVDYIVTIDTDSIYVDFGAFVDKAFPSGKTTDEIVDALSEFSEARVQKVINESFAAYAEYLNCFEPEALSMKREAIAQSAVFLVKKKYFLNIVDNEGVRYSLDERGVGNIKVMGLEAKKSSTPGVIREWMTDMFPLFLVGTEAEVQEMVAKRRDEHSALSPDGMAFNRSVSHVNKYADHDGNPIKGTPINSAAALAHNRAIKARDLAGVYPAIVDGDKMRYIHLIRPNPVDSHVLAWPDNWPTELELDSYIDHQTMFEKSFINPMKMVADAVGWDLVFRPKLDELF